jgi:hypothetical protein
MEELRRVGIIGQYSADFRGSQKHIFWPNIDKEVPHGILSREVKFTA